MSLKNSEAKKKFWSQFSALTKSKEMSARRKAGWAKKTEEERKAQGRKLTEIRLNKQKKVKTGLSTV